MVQEPLRGYRQINTTHQRNHEKENGHITWDEMVRRVEEKGIWRLYSSADDFSQAISLAYRFIVHYLI